MILVLKYVFIHLNTALEVKTQVVHDIFTFLGSTIAFVRLEIHAVSSGTFVDL